MSEETILNQRRRRRMATLCVMCVPAMLLIVNGCALSSQAKRDHELAGKYYHGTRNLPQDEVQAAQLYTKACKAGYSDSCAAACELGLAPACNELGVLYEEGSGVRKSAARAASHYLKACDGGARHGCYNLARSLAYAPGADERQLKRARRYYELACSMGMNEACQEVSEQP